MLKLLPQEMIKIKYTDLLISMIIAVLLKLLKRMHLTLTEKKSKLTTKDKNHKEIEDKEDHKEEETEMEVTDKEEMDK